MGAETLELPLEEKMRYEQGDTGYSFGFVDSMTGIAASGLNVVLPRYKARGTIMTDKNGTLDTVEFLNIAQDDALSWPRPTHRTYPDTVNARMHDTIIPFVRKSMDVNRTLLSLFEQLLGLQVGDLTTRHSERMVSGSEARCIKTPPNQNSAGIGAHTDFGSLVRDSSNSQILNLHTSPSSVIPAQPPWGTASDATWYRQVVVYQGSPSTSLRNNHRLNMI